MQVNRPRRLTSFSSCLNIIIISEVSSVDHIIGLVVKASALRVADPGFNSCLCLGDFSRSSHTSDLEIVVPVDALPDTWRYRVSTGTGWPSIWVSVTG